MSELVPVTKTEFELTEQADEEQITEADPSTQEILIYEVRGIKTPSGPGIKHLALQMSQEGQPLQIIDHKMELVKYDPDDKTQWVWQAEATVLNLTSQYQQIGVSEAWYLLRRKDSVIGDYDSFGRTKAMSKAQRNANSVHISTEMKQALYATSTPQNTRVMYLSGGEGDGGGSGAPRQPSDKQINYLRGLKWTRTVPTSIKEVSDLIDMIVKTSLEETEKNPKWNYLNKAASSAEKEKPTEQQLKELSALGHVGDIPFSETGASVLIDRLRRANAKPAATTTKKANAMIMCTCLKPQPTPEPQADGKYEGYHVCKECHSPLSHAKIEKMTEKRVAV